MNALFALWSGPIGTWGIADWAVATLVAGGIVAIVGICLRAMGVSPPPWLVQILWILLIVVVGVAAIIFLSRL